MSKATGRNSRADSSSPEQRLARLLETPALARLVPHLPPEALHQLVLHRGLEASTEIITAATAAQLTSLLDLDLWHRPQPGRDERFDVDRFGEWLEALVEAGDEIAAQTVARLDRKVVVAGLSRYVRVFDPGIFEPTAQSDDEAPDRHDAMREGDRIYDSSRSDGGLECEIGGYLVRARRADAWDAIVTLLAALEDEHDGFFDVVMQGCRGLSNSRPEIDGLDDLLLAPEQHLHEVEVERERRRSRHGYATPADARAFLEMARQRKRGDAALRNPIAAAYFRAAEESPAGPTDPPETTAAAPVDAILELLAEAGMMPESPRALLAAPEDPDASRLSCLRGLMRHLRETDEDTYGERSRELAFLANVLIAGCSVQSRPFTPTEASDAAAATCNLGLEAWPDCWATSAHSGTAPPESFLVDHSLITAFEIGWSVLHRDVGRFAAEQLIAVLTALQLIDDDIRRDLARLRSVLERHLEAGRPWLAREAADVIAALDMTAWNGVLGLLDECPVVPASVTAVVGGSTIAVSQTEFAFISTADQIDAVRAFMEKLPGLLSG